MESFTVQCTSCQSRIRVRNPNMIGQIANCPKCSSMIMITPPQKITVESGNPTDSVAVTREALPPPDPAHLHATRDIPSAFRSAVPPPDDAQLADTPAYADPLANDPLANDFAADAGAFENPDFENQVFENLAPSAWMPEAPPAADSEPVAASINNVRSKRLEAAGKNKQVMMIVGIGSLSALLALAMLFVFLNWFAKPAEKTIANNKPVVVDPGKPKADKPATETTPAEQPSETPDHSAVTPAENGLPVEPDTLTIEPVEPAPDNSNHDNGNKMPTTPDAGTPDATSAVPKESVTPPRAPTVPLGKTIAPDLNDVLGTPDKTADAGSKASAELPPGLQNFANLFAPSIEPVLPDAPVPLGKAPEVADNAPKPTQADVAPVDSLPSIVEKRLGLPLSGLLIDKRPLSETLCTLALVADMPVMADLDSIIAGGLPRNPVIEFRSPKTTKVGEVCSSIEKETGISFVPWENKVLYARASDALLEKRIPESLPIDDLVSDAQQTEALLHAIKEVLPEVADASLVDGQLQLKLNSENRIVWFQVARLLESWRVVRGIKNPSTSELVPAKNILPTWPVAAIEPFAQTKIKQTLSSKEPMARTWQRFTFEAKVACWVDWYSLAAAKTSPADAAMVINRDRSLADLLQHYANVYRVVFAIEDGRNLWVTTPEAHRVQPRLYLLPLADKTAEAWTEELEELAPLHPVTGENMFKAVPTPDGQYLIVRACRPVLCQPERY